MSRVDLLCKKAVLLKTVVNAGSERVNLIRRHDHARRIGCAQRIANGIQIIDFSAETSVIIGIGKNTQFRIRISRDTVL